MVCSCGVRRWVMKLGKAEGAWLRLLTITSPGKALGKAQTPFFTARHAARLFSAKPAAHAFEQALAGGVIGPIPFGHGLVDVVGVDVDLLGVASLAAHKKILPHHDDFRHRAAPFAMP